MRIGGLKISSSSSGKRLSTTSSSHHQPSLKKSKNLVELESSDDSSNHVKINLLNFNENDCGRELIIKLKKHWSIDAATLNNSVFKYNFNRVGEMDGSESFENSILFTNPFDVKISQHHQVIIVLDNILNRILFFDLNSLELWSYLQVPSEAWALALEMEYCESGNDALYVIFEYGKVIKYDLERLLDNNNNFISSDNQVWVQDNFDSPYSTVVSYGSKSYNEKYHYSENTVYVCDFGSNCVAILEASTGEPITMIEFSSPPQSIDFLNDRHLVVSLSESIMILEKDRNTDWKCIKKFDDVHSNYLICDRDSNKILCSNKVGVLVIDMKNSTTEVKVLGSCPISLALNGPYLYYALIDKRIDIYE